MGQAAETIEFVLSHRQEIKDAIIEKRAGRSGNHTGGVGSGHAFVSDPTAQTALRIVTPISAIDVPFGPYICGLQEHFYLPQPEKWLYLARKVQEHFEAESPILADFYRSKYIRLEHWSRTCGALHISRGAYYGYRKDVLYYASIVGVYLGVLEPTRFGVTIKKA